MKVLHYTMIMILLVLSTISCIQLHAVDALVPLTIITIQGGANSPSCGNSCIIPQNVTVERGTAVRWINNDLVPHFIVSGNSGENDTGSLFNSGSISVGSNFMRDFNDVGVFHYFDPTHTWDTGTIHVIDNTFLNSSFYSTPANSQSNEELAKKLASARDTITNLMINGTGDIPFNEVGVIEKNMTLEVGIDSTKATFSGEYYVEKIKAIVGDIPIKITFGVINTTANMTNSSEENSFSKLIQSPLKQFKSGINTQKITCSQDLHLIIKAEDGSPACVESKSATVLILRGWGHESDNEQVLYFMKLNSAGKLFVKYTYTENDGSNDVNPQILNGSTMHRVSPTLIELEADHRTIINDSDTITYTIKSHDAKGVYWLSLDWCRFVPLVVGLDNFTITNLDLQFSLSGLSCPVSLLQYKIVGFEGIEPEYVRIQ